MCLLLSFSVKEKALRDKNLHFDKFFSSAPLEI